MKAVYLAGPEVFLADAKAAGLRKQALCAAHGFRGLYPLDSEPAAGLDLDGRIYAANLAMIRAADAGIFNLTPFRGIAADAGTVFELGLMAGLGKPVFGYTNTAADLLARIPGVRLAEDGVWRDAAGLMAEDFGNADNLMIDACLRAGGSGIVRLERGGSLENLEAFETCLTYSRAALR